MAEKKGREKVTGILKIALVATVLLIGLTPLVTALVIDFDIDPDKLLAGECEETLFVVWVNMSEDSHWQNTSIPAGCTLILPTDLGKEIVSTELWNATGPVAEVTILTNDTDPAAPTVDIKYVVGDDYGSMLGKPISFTPGIPFTIDCPWGNKLEMCLPTDTEAGYLNFSTNRVFTSVRDEWLVRFCCPPNVTSESVFIATAEGDLVGLEELIVCAPPPEVPVYNTLGMAGLIGIMSVVLGFATMRRRS